MRSETVAKAGSDLVLTGRERSEPGRRNRFIACAAIIEHTFVLWQESGDLTGARMRKLSEAGFTGFYDLAGLPYLQHGTVAILVIPKS